MSGINPNYKGCVFCGQEECDCPYPNAGREAPERAKRLCQEHASEYFADYGEEATVVEQDSCAHCTRHQPGCICADCSGAELTSDND